MTKVSHAFSQFMHFLLLPNNISYTGGTSLPADAADVRARLVNGESLLEGPHIREFEEALSNYYDGAAAITFGAGRMALYAILKAMDLKPEDEIILPGYTCVVTSSAIIYAGLKPVYVDVSPDDFNMTPESVTAAITPRTRAILAQHTFGIPFDIRAMLDISQRHGIPLIEDGAHAIGARWNGKLTGLFGYAAFFSTQGTKMFSTERGGYVITMNAELAKKIKQIQLSTEYDSIESVRASIRRWCYRARYSGRPWLNPRLTLLEYLVQKLRFPRTYYDVLEYDRSEYESALEGIRPDKYPTRMPNLLAYAGLLQLRRIEKDINHRRLMAGYLETHLPAFGAKVAVYDHKISEPSWVRFPFVVAERDKWLTSMRRCGISPGFWLDDPIHPKGSNYQKAGYARGMCPNAEYLSEHILNCPVDTRMDIKRLEKWLHLLKRM